MKIVDRLPYYTLEEIGVLTKSISNTSPESKNDGYWSTMYFIWFLKDISLYLSGEKLLKYDSTIYVLDESIQFHINHIHNKYCKPLDL